MLIDRHISRVCREKERQETDEINERERECVCERKREEEEEEGAEEGGDRKIQNEKEGEVW